VQTGQWIPANGQQQQIPEIVLRMEHHRQVAESFVEDKDSWHKATVRTLVQAACYLVPVTLAILAGLAIGEQYAASAGQSIFYAPFSFAVGVGVELMLWGLSFGASIEFKRTLSDRSHVKTLVILCFAFVAFSVMSMLAQYLVYEMHAKDNSATTQIGMFFRSGATTCADVSALLVLAVIEFEDFKAHLKKQKDVAEHVRDLSRVEVEAAQIRQEEIRRQKEAEIDSERKLRQAQFLADLEQNSFNNSRQGGGSRESRGRW
jgi:hypothetical protein